MIPLHKKQRFLFVILTALLLTACVTTSFWLAAALTPLFDEITDPAMQYAAQAGDANAQYKLGAAYASGQGVTKDNVKAVEWLQKSANQGNAPAQNALSVMYLKGLGVTKNEMKAIEWLQKAAAQGNSEAKNRLAGLYAQRLNKPSN